MIVVSISKNEVSVRGHSGYAENGEDIVCAGVSVLLQDMVKSIEDLTEDEIEYSLTPGNGVVTWENLSEQGKLLVDSFFIGICMFTERYPDYVRIA